ncbi:uncharacterized protein LOC132722172 [Ruditapes philippinarum]|uniref:uncharacterized protein LOC132722172 n=1 Tax=Ruditapes philippinarum TaxID=129788 RepID=UPI00295B5017|nr:uncharacterized protein LOC132722172 [Ruditapes philippinarum]XP_060562598.1 uncharacterized protein LOC132722172 [Ruditapes philippinarum]
MAGKLTAETKHELSKNICDFIQNGRQQLFRIAIDDLGLRLQVKLNMVPHGLYIILNSPETYNLSLLNSDFLYIVSNISVTQLKVLEHLYDKNIRTMKQSLGTLKTFSVNCNRLQQTCKYLAPFLFTTYGSVLASSYIGQNNKVSPEALVWLLDGLNSDISSSRLKLASVFYSTGNMEKAEVILRHIEQQYYSYPVVAICECWRTPPPAVTAEFKRVCSEQSVDCIKHITAFCVRFIKVEINCVPHELQYEMFRSTQDDMIHRDKIEDFWMNLAIVDSLPFLYFLLYKIYRHLQRQQDQQQAISKLIRTIATDKNLGHRETALNILGQCMEQENRPQQALKCYLLSLQQRARNNAANFHICKLLFGVLAGQ